MSARDIVLGGESYGDTEVTLAETAASVADRELVLTRLIDAPREALYRCWTEPELLKQWFAPAPFTTLSAELDVRTGGANLIVMQSPEGQEMPNRGVYLEVVPNRRIVFTDAYVSAWEPSPNPFMTVILTFEDGAPARPATPPVCATSPSRAASGTSRWASIKAGANAPTSWPRWRSASDAAKVAGHAGGATA
jgi:uncharacterized protein YndB with AHSA1/START domain